MFNMILRIIPFLITLSLGFAKVNKSVTDIYTIENDTSYSLIIEHDSKSTIDYLVKEIFDPPTVFIELKNLVFLVRKVLKMKFMLLVLLISFFLL